MPSTTDRLVEIKSATQLEGCRKLGSSSSESKEGGRRGKLAARAELRQQAKQFQATHILFVKGERQPGGRFSGVTEAAVFYGCDQPEASKTVAPEEVSTEPAMAARAAAQPSVGTCFFVNGSGLAVTSQSIIVGATSLQVVLNDGTTREAMLVRQQANVDLALLQVRGEVKTAFLVPTERSAALGERPFAIGFSGTASNAAPTFLEGTIESLRVADHDSLLALSMSVPAEFSGGALVRSDGSLLGTVLAADRVRQLGQARAGAATSFAIKAPLVQRMLGADAPDVPVVSRAREDAIDNAVRATCRVIVKRGEG